MLRPLAAAAGLETQTVGSEVNSALKIMSVLNIGVEPLAPAYYASVMKGLSHCSLITISLSTQLVSKQVFHLRNRQQLG